MAYFERFSSIPLSAHLSVRLACESRNNRQTLLMSLTSTHSDNERSS